MGRNKNVLDDDSWNEMYSDKGDPHEYPGKRHHPMHPDDRPSTEYKDNDKDPEHDQYDEGEDKMPPELMNP